MAMTNHERLGKALELLKSGLGPFVERELKRDPDTVVHELDQRLHRPACADPPAAG